MMSKNSTGFSRGSIKKIFLLAMFMILFSVVVYGQAFSIDVACSSNVSGTVQCDSDIKFYCIVNMSDPTNLGIRYVKMLIGYDLVYASLESGDEFNGVWSYNITPQIVNEQGNYPKTIEFKQVKVKPWAAYDELDAFEGVIPDNCSNFLMEEGGGDYFAAADQGCEIDFTPDAGVVLVNNCSCSIVRVEGSCEFSAGSRIGGVKWINYSAPSGCVVPDPYTEDCVPCTVSLIPKYSECTLGSMSVAWETSNESCCIKLGEFCKVPDPESIPCTKDEYLYYQELDESGDSSSLLTSNLDIPKFRYDSYFQVASDMVIPEGYQPIVADFDNDGKIEIVIVNDSMDKLVVYEYYQGSFSIDDYADIEINGNSAQIVGHPGFDGSMIAVPVMYNGSSYFCKYYFKLEPTGYDLTNHSCISVPGNINASGIYCYDNYCYFQTMVGAQTHVANRVSAGYFLSSLNLTYDAVSGSDTLGWPSTDWNVPMVGNFWQTGDPNEVVFIVPINSSGSKSYRPIITKLGFEIGGDYFYPPRASTTPLPTDIYHPSLVRNVGAGKGDWYFTAKYESGGNTYLYLFAYRILSPSASAYFFETIPDVSVNWTDYDPDSVFGTDTIGSIVCKNSAFCVINVPNNSSKHYIWNGEEMFPFVYGDFYMQDYDAGWWYGIETQYTPYPRFVRTDLVSVYEYFEYNGSELYGRTPWWKQPKYISLPKQIDCELGICYLYTTTGIYKAESIQESVKIDATVVANVEEGGWTENTRDGIKYKHGNLWRVTMDGAVWGGGGTPCTAKLYWWNFSDSSWVHAAGSTSNQPERSWYLDTWEDKYLFYSVKYNYVFPTFFDEYHNLSWGDMDNGIHYTGNVYQRGSSLNESGGKGFGLAFVDNITGYYLGNATDTGYSTGIHKLDLSETNMFVCGDNLSCLYDEEILDISDGKTRGNLFVLGTEGEEGGTADYNGFAVWTSDYSGRKFRYRPKITDYSQSWLAFRATPRIGYLPGLYNGKMPSDPNNWTANSFPFEFDDYEALITNFDNSIDFTKEIIHEMDDNKLIVRNGLNFVEKSLLTGYDQVSEAVACDIDFDEKKEYIAIFRSTPTSIPYLRAFKYDGGILEEFGDALPLNDIPSGDDATFGNLICTNFDDNPLTKEIIFKSYNGYFYIISWSGGTFANYAGHGVTLSQNSHLTYTHSVTEENYPARDILLLENWYDDVRAVAFVQQEDDENFRLWVYDQNGNIWEKDFNIGLMSGVLDNEKRKQYVRSVHVVNFNNSRIIVAASGVARFKDSDDGYHYSFWGRNPESKFFVFKANGYTGITTEISKTFTPRNNQVFVSGMQDMSILLYPFYFNGKVGYIREYINPEKYEYDTGKVHKHDYQIWTLAGILDGGATFSTVMSDYTSEIARPILYPLNYDWDDDGDDDIFWAGRTGDLSYEENNAVFIHSGGVLSTGLPSFKTAPIFADLNNDDKVDAIYGYMNDDEVRVYTDTDANISSSEYTSTIELDYKLLHDGTDNTVEVTNPIFAAYGSDEYIAIETYVGNDESRASLWEVSTATKEPYLSIEKTLYHAPGTVRNIYLTGVDILGDLATSLFTPFGVFSFVRDAVLTTLFKSSTNFGWIIPVNLNSDKYLDLIYTQNGTVGAFISSIPFAETFSVSYMDLEYECTTRGDDNDIIVINARGFSSTPENGIYELYMIDNTINEAYQVKTYADIGPDEYWLSFDPIIARSAGTYSYRIIYKDGVNSIEKECTVTVPEPKTYQHYECQFTDNFLYSDSVQNHGWTCTSPSLQPLNGYLTLECVDEMLRFAREIDCDYNNLYIEFAVTLSDDAHALIEVYGSAEDEDGVLNYYPVSYLRLKADRALEEGDGYISTFVDTKDVVLATWNSGKTGLDTFFSETAGISSVYRFKMSLNGHYEDMDLYFDSGLPNDMNNITYNYTLKSVNWLTRFQREESLYNVLPFDLLRFVLYEGDMNLYYVKIYATDADAQSIIFEEHPGVELLRECKINEYCTDYSDTEYRYCPMSQLKDLAKAIPANYDGGCFSQLLDYCINTSYPIEYFNFDGKNLPEGGKLDFLADRGAKDQAIMVCSTLLTVSEGTHKILFPLWVYAKNMVIANIVFVIIAIFVLIIVIKIFYREK